MLTQKIEIGKVCMKGPHPAYEGQSDYGCCGSNYFATIYVTLEEDYPNPRGEGFDLSKTAKMIAELVKAEEERAWSES